MEIKDLSMEAFLKAIRICQSYQSVIIAINYNPEANPITKDHQLVLKQCPPELTEALIKEGYSLSLREYGLIVSKF